MNYDQIMVDLETLGLNRDAMVVSIGAVRFSLDDHPQGPLGGFLPYTGGIFYERFELSGYGHIDPKTLTWWMQQPEAARLAAFGEGSDKSPVPPRRPATQIWKDFDEFLRKQPVTGFWSNGPLFDEDIIRHNFLCEGIEWPISFRATRDYRTIRDLGKAVGIEPIEPHGTKHHALDDACNQAENVLAVYRLCKLARSVK